MGLNYKTNICKSNPCWISEHNTAQQRFLNFGEEFFTNAFKRESETSLRILPAKKMHFQYTTPRIPSIYILLNVSLIWLFSTVHTCTRYRKNFSNIEEHGWQGLYANFQRSKICTRTGDWKRGVPVRTYKPNLLYNRLFPMFLLTFKLLVLPLTESEIKSLHWTGK